MKRSILFVIDCLTWGGAEKVLSVLVKNFDYEKYDVTVCPIVDGGIYCEEVKRYATNYCPIITYDGSVLSRLWNKIKYKLVYSYLPLQWVYQWFIPKGHDVEIAFCEGFVTKLLMHAHTKSERIAWVHTDLIDNPWPIDVGIFKDLDEERSIYSDYDKIVCVSKTVHYSFCELFGMEDHVTTIYNPIDIDDICHKAEPKIKREDNTIRFISAGRFVAQKGFDRLLKVVKRLHDSGFPVQLEIIGDGEGRDSLDKYVQNNAMKSYVFLPGFTDNPYRQFNNADIFVCSSRAEGFSLVIAEAMVVGIPVVSTYCSGPNELLEEGKYGMLVDNSEESLYLGLEKAITNMDQMKDYVKAAQIRIQDFSPQAIIQKVESLLNTN